MYKNSVNQLKNTIKNMAEVERLQGKVADNTKKKENIMKIKINKRKLKKMMK